MRSSKPFLLIFLSAIVIFLFYCVAFIFSSFYFRESINWVVFIISGSVILIVVFIIFSYIIKKYIHDRIKLIYKTIHNLKLGKDEKFIKIKLNDDMIHQTNKEVLEWAESKKHEVEKLKNLETYRREFLGNVSHELKTPIFNIQGYILTLLGNDTMDAVKRMEYLQKTEKNIDRMINIVQDLENISQLESGVIKLEYSRFDMISLSQEIIEMLEAKAKQKNIRLIFQEGLSLHMPIFVWADKERIKQVLINLIDNSIKYGKEEGRTKLSFYDMDENILVEVSDNGIGIEESHIPRLFERFYRIDKSRSRHQGGSGLGLAIVKHIIESHEQTVNVRSTPEVGSTFSFTLKKA